MLCAMLCVSCSFQAAVVLDLGASSDPSSAREKYASAGRALEQIGFEPVPSASPRSEGDRFVATYFRDPNSPQARPDAWYVQLLLTKAGNTVQVILAQPGATEPSGPLKARSADVAAKLRSLMPATQIVMRGGDA